MFKVLVEGCEPKRGTKFSACVDLFASEDVVIGAGETKVVGLGVCIDLENSNVHLTSDYRFAFKKDVSMELLNKIKKQSLNDFMHSHYLQLMLRSSLGKKGLILPNGVGVIDLDYKDEIKMIVHNPLTGNIFRNYDGGTQISKVREPFRIKKGDKIGQITLLEHKGYLLGIDSDVERNGGIGSTGE